MTKPRNTLGGGLLPLMTTKERADPTDVRTNNRMAVFSLLFPNDAMSRAQLGRRTGLSRVSVSEVVSDLIEHHILKEAGPRTDQTRRGKKGTLISVDASQWNIVTLDLSQPYLMQGAIMDPLGHTLAHAEQPLEHEREASPDVAMTLCSRLLDDVSAPVLGIGVATTGIVDGGGTIIDSRNLGWTNVPIGPMLEERFGLPVIVNNDAHSAMLDERFFGEGTPNMLFIYIAGGVGASLLISDSVVLGPTHAAGEIGHVVIDPEGEPCICGKRGCLETVLAAPRLRARLANDAAHRTDILASTGRTLGGAMAMPANLLDLDEVVVYGPPEIVNDTFVSSAEESLNACLTSSLHKHVGVRRCQRGTGLVMRGESVAVLQSALQRL